MKALLTLILFAGFSVVAFAETRTWTSTDGKSIEAELVRASDTTVTVKLENGKNVPIKLNQLSEDDQKFVKDWQADVKEKEMAAKKAAKLSRITSFRWEKSYKKVIAEAQELDLPVAILFTGTSWCGYCVKLEDEVFSKGAFKKLAAGKFLGLKYEAPTNAGPKSKEGKELAKKFGVSGYPKVVYVDKEGKVLGTNGYHKGITPESFVKGVEKLTGKK